MAAAVYRRGSDVPAVRNGWRAVVQELHGGGVGCAGSGGGLPAWAAPRAGEAVYAFDESKHGAAAASSAPLLPDPWEAERVAVAPSPMPGAGEGLFARVALTAGDVAAFYKFGVRLSHEAVDARDWRLNANTISLGEQTPHRSGFESLTSFYAFADADTVIDIPPGLVPVTAYCASLGHKANHHTRPNAEYAPFCHPRFGDIKCVRTTQLIAPGEEITVDYSYDLLGADGVPEWYRALYQHAGDGGPATPDAAALGAEAGS
eukprot:SM000015S01294  [mRNA]  locus=s15:1163189:1164794:+ [translate_table: standard]